MLSAQHDKPRLEFLLDNASANLATAQKERNDQGEEIAKAHMVYFDKLAFGASAIMAAIVSFLGSKRDLHPSWLLRTTITSLSVIVVLVFIRNAIYPYYGGNVYWRRALQAEIERDRLKAEYFMRFPSLNIDTGEPIDAINHMANYRANKAVVDKRAAQLERKEDAIFNSCMVLERIALALSALVSILLVALIWMNF